MLFWLLVALPACAQESQQFDVGFGVGTVVAPSSSSALGNHSPQTIGGGAYLGFTGDYLSRRHIGVEGEVDWKASQGLYGGYQPFRPIFYDFNAIYAPPLGKHAQLELLGGIGGLSTRFYTQNYTCDYFTYICTNYVSSNHFMGDVGAGWGCGSTSTAASSCALNFGSTSSITMWNSAAGMPPARE